jgi:hypothetical protein
MRYPVSTWIRSNKPVELTGHSVGFPAFTMVVACGQQLTGDVDMTSNVKSGQQIFSGLHDVFLPFVHRKSRSQ